VDYVVPPWRCPRPVPGARRLRRDMRPPTARTRIWRSVCAGLAVRCLPATGPGHSRKRHERPQSGDRVKAYQVQNAQSCTRWRYSKVMASQASMSIRPRTAMPACGCWCWITARQPRIRTLLDHGLEYYAPAAAARV
jgi:hypothetical protein